MKITTKTLKQIIIKTFCPDCKMTHHKANYFSGDHGLYTAAMFSCMDQVKKLPSTEQRCFYCQKDAEAKLAREESKKLIGVEDDWQ